MYLSTKYLLKNHLEHGPTLNKRVKTLSQTKTKLHYPHFLFEIESILLMSDVIQGFVADVVVLGLLLSKNFLDPFPTYKKEFLRSTNRSFYNPQSSRTLSKQKDGGEITTSSTTSMMNCFMTQTTQFSKHSLDKKFFWKI